VRTFTDSMQDLYSEEDSPILGETGHTVSIGWACRGWRIKFASICSTRPN